MVLERVSVLLGVLTVASVAVAQSAVDGSYYCSSTYDCPNVPARSHVMCAYPTNFSSNCASNPAFVPTTDSLRTIFLDGHNSRRNTAALGELTGAFSGKTATRMAEVTWDDELEMFAQKLLLECSLTHDQCHKSLKYNYPGTNTAYQCNTPAISAEEGIQAAITGWWNEYLNVNSISDDNDFSSIQASNTYDHFTQMAHDNAFKIGCATISTDGGCYYVACNYAVTNWDNDPVYAVGTIRSSCQTQSSTYSGLCGQNEDYTTYTSRGGITFFNNDNTVPDAVTTFINNRRVLFGSSGTSADATTSSSVTSSSDTASTGSQSVNPVIGAANNGSGISLPIGSGQNQGFLICNNNNKCKRSKKTTTKKPKSKSKSKKQKKQSKSKKKCGSKCSSKSNKTKKIKYQVFPG